jgi:surface carbohydrate biosynthesis protein
MIAYLPIEIKDREYMPKILLAHYILKNKKKSSIIISRSRLARQLIQNYKNAFFFDKSLSIHKVKISEEIIKNNVLSVLDEEGPITNWVSYMEDTRLPLDILKKTDLYFVRGNDEKKFLEKKFNLKLQNVKVVGHPKYDLLNYPYYNFYKNEATLIKKRFKKFVFIPLSFTHDLKGSNDYSKYLIKNFAKTKTLKKKLKDSINTWDVDLKNYNNFMQLIKELANENKSLNFILRPHPTQDIHKIQKRIKNKPKNLHFVYKYSITPWILSCDYYLHSHCTSVYEAAKLKKKIFCYNLNHKGKGVKLLRNPSYFFSDTKKFKLFFKKIIEKKAKYDFKKVHLDNGFLFNFKDDKSSCSEILKHFLKLNKNISNDNFNINQSILAKLRISFRELIFLLVKLRNYFFRENDYFKNKYFEVTQNEIDQILSKLKNLDKSKYKIKFKKLDKDVILINNF